MRFGRRTCDAVLGLHIHLYLGDIEIILNVRMQICIRRFPPPCKIILNIVITSCILTLSQVKVYATESSSIQVTKYVICVLYNHFKNSTECK